MDPAGAPEPAERPLPQRGGEPLVPILRIEEGLGDPVALATWHEALSDSLSADVPHDLLGLWLYPAQGGAVLLGPEALAADHLTVPLPHPQLQPSQVSVLEEIVRDAGYGSAVCLPIRFGRRDVGLLLVADLRPARYGEATLPMLRLVAQRLAPVLGRIARQWEGAASSSRQLERIAALLEGVAGANAHAGTPQLFLAALSRALEPLLPHDTLELLLADTAGSRCFRLGEHAGGPLWADPSLSIGREHLDVEALFGGHDDLLVADTYRDPRWPRGYFTVVEPAGAEPRAIVGARVRGPKGLAAYLLAGSVGADLYGEEDAALLLRLAALIAPQVALFVAAGSDDRRATAPPAGTSSFAEVAELLAVGTDLAEVTRRVAELAGRVLPFDEMRFAIRLSEGDRVVLFQPGERRALPDQPLVPVAGTALARVLLGELPSVFSLEEGGARLLVPLRVAGRVHGALVLTAAHPAVLREVHIQPAQQLADVLAPHLELLRRAALLPPPYMPGWKKVK